MHLRVNTLLVFSVYIAGVFVAHAGEAPDKKHQAAITKGLAWLAKQQHADGGWGATASESVAAVTAFAGLALLSEGSTPSKGTYAENLKRAADWYVQNCQKGRDEGLLGTRETRDPHGYMWGHGHGLLFLASVYAGEDDRPDGKELKDLLHRARRKEYREVLKRAVAFTVKAQGTKGGWYFISGADGDDSDDAESSLCQIQALRAAQLAGVDDPKTTIDKAMAYLEKYTSAGGGLYFSSRSTSERPALTVAALACALKPGDYRGDLAKKWLKFATDTGFVMRRIGGYNASDVYQQWHSAQVMHGLGENLYDELFGQKSQVKWSHYRKLCFAEILGMQKADGSWSIATQGIGPEFPTAIHLMVLQLDKEAVPIFRTKKMP
jgi:hypothetical protein